VIFAPAHCGGSRLGRHGQRLTATSLSWLDDTEDSRYVVRTETAESDIAKAVRQAISSIY
jgi:hypothetical protein